jgi:hypothetical protein
MQWFRRNADHEPERPGPDPAADPDDSPAALMPALDAAITAVNRAAGELPTIAWVQARHLTDTLARILTLARTRPLDIDAVILVSATVTDYLPTTLRAYLAVPANLRDVPAPSGAVPSRALVDQLDALQAAAQAKLDSACADDIDALLTQGAFLTTKFLRSELDLP